MTNGWPNGSAPISCCASPLPIGLVVFPGSGITDNLADKARKLGIGLMDYRKRGA